MCGIAGIFARPGTTFDTERFGATCRQMLASIEHRGPDSNRIVAGGHFFLGHTRLSIIDLDGGLQPMYSADQRYLLSANGEIYNHQSLRQDRLSGYQYTSGSDSEVITAAYDALGEAGLSLLNGMFAFALVDQQHRSVFCAVDPVAIKPLYYCQTNGVLLVASELKAIVVGLHALGARVEMCLESASAYLSNGWVDSHRSIVKGVMRLAPGESLTLDAAGKLLVKQYCKVHDTVADCAAERPVDLAQLRDALQSALTRQLIADVPTGFFLSGGIDSSLLVALARKAGVDARTFTVDFVGSTEAASVSEAAHAKTVAKQLGCSHHELRFDAAMLSSRLDEVFEFLDEPLADPAVIPLSVISEFAREHVKVCISGDGGDELFSGYLRHALHRPRQIVTNSSIAKPVVRSLGVAFQSAFDTFGRPQLLRQGALAFDMLSSESFVYGPFCGRNAHWLQSQPGRASASRQAGATRENASLFALEMAGPLPGQMLTKMDRSSMSKGLEVRVPFLDLEFLRTALRFPISQNRKGKMGKLPLRLMLSEFVPDTISQRPKQGFRVPISDWIRNDLHDEIRERLLDRSCIPESLIARASVEQLLDQHDARIAEHSIRIWALLSLNESIARLDIA